MSTYEITTPLIAKSVEAARAAIAGIQDGSLEPRHAAILISGARAFQNAVSTDIKARIAAPKISAQEAKLIEASGGRSGTTRKALGN